MAFLNMSSFALQVLGGRWFMVFASFLIMSTASLSFLFGIYSPYIKSTLGYDQTTLNLLSFSKDIGYNIGIPAGLIAEVTPPWVVLLIGAILNFFAYFMIWLGLTNKIPTPKVSHMCAYMCIGANSQTFSNTAALVTCVKNFPRSRGIVIGLLKAYTSLSGAIATQLYHAIYGNDHPESLILMISWFPAAMNIAFLSTIRLMRVVRQTNELKVFYKFLYITLGFVGFLMVAVIFEKRFKFTMSEYGGTIAIVLFLLFLPIVVVIKEEYTLWQQKEASRKDTSDIEVVEEKHVPNVTLPPQQPPPIPQKKEDVSCFKTMFQPPDRGEDYTILQALFSIDMLILCLATSCGVGGALTAIDNLGQIGTSLGYPTQSLSTFVSLLSIWSSLGKLVCGFVSEILLVKYKFPRTLVLTLVLALLCVGHILIATGVPYSIYFAFMIIGFCLGSLWPLLFTIISEIFGLKYYSTLYNVGTLACPIGSYLLNVSVTGHLYDKEANRQMKALGITRKAGEELNCNGIECFRLAFIIITGVTFFGALVSLILVLRTRKFYQSDIYQKFDQEVKAAEMEMAVAANGEKFDQEVKAAEMEMAVAANGVVPAG